jgi:hypothetical protein
MAQRGKPRFIAFKFLDPMTSPRIKQDESLAHLLTYLCETRRPMVFGPAIYLIPVKENGKLADAKTESIAIGMWVGGYKIRLFEDVEAPPAPGVDFITQTEFEINYEGN